MTFNFRCFQPHKLRLLHCTCILYYNFLYVLICE